MVVGRGTLHDMHSSYMVFNVHTSKDSKPIIITKHDCCPTNLTTYFCNLVFQVTTES